MRTLYRILPVLVVVSSILLAACTAGPTTEPSADSPPSSGETESDAPTATDTPIAEPTAGPTTEPSADSSPSSGETEPDAPTATDTPIAEPTVGPIPTASLAPLTAAGSEALAYVQDGTLYIYGLERGETVPVESCQAGNTCILHYFKWSPDGRYLLYYYYDGQNDSLRLSDRQGQVQTISADVAFIRPGAWSPDGQTIAFFRETDTFTEGSDIQPPAHVHEVWTAAIGEGGAVTAPQLIGNVNMRPPGCGGGGRSPSEELYEQEGGTSYGYRMGVTEWTAQGILLYTTNCGNVGIGRFDLNSGTELEPFTTPLRNLVLNDTRDRWFAVTGPTWSEGVADHQLATGTPDSTEIQTIATSQPVELVFYGQESGRLYYTVRQLVERAELSDRGFYFAFYNAALWAINPDGSSETMLYQAEDQAFANVSERPVGTILFTRVENDRPMYEAAQDATVTDLSPYLPQRHIVEIGLTGGEPSVLIENAGQPALSPVP